MRSRTGTPRLAAMGIAAIDDEDDDDDDWAFDDANAPLVTDCVFADGADAEDDDEDEIEEDEDAEEDEDEDEAEAAAERAARAAEC
jgi:hypothetical protein